jgi:hypothetical protein
MEIEIISINVHSLQACPGEDTTKICYQYTCCSGCVLKFMFSLCIYYNKKISFKQHLGGQAVKFKSLRTCFANDLIDFHAPLSRGVLIWLVS